MTFNKDSCKKSENKQKPVTKASAPSIKQVNLMLGMCEKDKEEMVILLAWNLVKGDVGSKTIYQHIIK